LVVAQRLPAAKVSNQNAILIRPHRLPPRKSLPQEHRPPPRVPSISSRSDAFETGSQLDFGHFGRLGCGLKMLIYHAPAFRPFEFRPVRPRFSRSEPPDNDGAKAIHASKPLIAHDSTISRMAKVELRPRFKSWGQGGAFDLDERVCAP
jgi:hypothetical protein